MNHLFHRLAKRIPQLELRLRQADMKTTPVEFTRQAVMSSFYLSAGFCGALAIISVGKLILPALVLFPLFFFVSTWYFLKSPDVKIKIKAKEIDKEIVFAGKFMIIEINSGVPLYQTLKNIGSGYSGIGRYFNNIIKDVDLGTEMEEAINNAILLNPSNNFRKVMWQLSNSLRTGADVAMSLTGVLEQINKEQMIEVEKYGKKLNPIAVFYLMLAVIIPSLGTVMGVIFASFAKIPVRLGALILIAVCFGLFQFMFYAIIKSNRPAVDL